MGYKWEREAFTIVTSMRRNGEKGNHSAYQGGYCITLESLEPSSQSVACWVGGSSVSGTLCWLRLVCPLW